MEHKWKEIELINGKYLVSDNGIVINANKNKIQPQFLAGRGYCAISLQTHKHKKNYLVHRLVGELFIPNPNNFPQINHINGIKTDNRVENLEWCDNSYNNLHAIKMGLKTYTDRMKQVLQIKDNKVIAEYCSVREASKKTGIHYAAIYDVARNKPHRKTAGGYQWVYKLNYEKK